MLSMVSHYFNDQQVVVMRQDTLQDAVKSRTDEEDCLLKKKDVYEKWFFFFI